MNEIHIALTGHRPAKLAGYDLNNTFYSNLYNYLLSLIDKAVQAYPDKIIWLHSGLALGADTVWGLAALKAKSMFPNVKFYAEIPVESQSDKWFNSDDKLRWKTLVQNADGMSVYSDHYTKTCLNDRNIGMVNHADFLIAIWDGSASGTKNAVEYAVKNNKTVIYAKPDQFRQ